ncbi:MAG: hypothetical protein IPI02_04270 [Sterolibacteriaceae bacterium]|nr:hypothetical protein [Sterolibacteriaceae bacterium]
MTARQQAARFSRQLTQRWVSENAQAVGLLYVDGHVRPYHGTTHKLPKAWVARRRLCMPATTDIWVNQQDAQPLFVVSAEANDNLLAMLRREILPQVRELVGERRVTLAFDREGWSPKFFQEVFAQGFDVLTYRKGAYAQWPKRVFRTVEAIIDGRKVSYQLAERSIRVLPGFRMREVRRLCDNGHQTSIVTTRTDWPIEVVAWRMFERWTQENFFRYMRQHFALDALVELPSGARRPRAHHPQPRAQGTGQRASRQPRRPPGARTSLRPEGARQPGSAAAHHARVQDRAGQIEPATARSQKPSASSCEYASHNCPSGCRSTRCSTTLRSSGSPPRPSTSPIPSRCSRSAPKPRWCAV